MATEDHESDTDPNEPDPAAADAGEEPAAARPESEATSPAESPAQAADETCGAGRDEAVSGDTPTGTAEEPPEGAEASGDGYATGSIKRILEAALLVAGRPLAITDFEKLFGGSTEAPPRNAVRAALAELATDWSGRSLALQEVASGWRAQVRTEFEPWIARLWDEKPPRYSRALLETLAIIAYRQPMTRSEIEDIRGVSVSSQIIRTLTEREWIRVVGHREAPGRPAMYGTTREFLDYFNLKTLDQLPPISDIKDLEGQYPELGFEAEPASGGGASADAPDGDTVSPESRDADADNAAAADEARPTASNEGGDANILAVEGQTSMNDDPQDATADGDTPAARDDDTDEDDPEESPCTPAS